MNDSVPSTSVSFTAVMFTRPSSCPAGITSELGVKVKSSPSFAVPETVIGTVTSSADDDPRRTTCATVPSVSTTLEVGVTKPTVGGSSSSLIVRVCTTIAPRSQLSPLRRVTTASSSGSSMPSTTIDTSMLALVAPAGITSGDACGMPKSTPPAAAVPPIPNATLESSVRDEERVSAIDTIPADSAAVCVATSNETAAAGSSSSMISSWTVTAPS